MPPVPASAPNPPFNFHSTAAQVVMGLSLKGKRVVITGASSGLGLETARVLASIGGEITLAVRDAEAGARAAESIARSTGNTAVNVMILDLGDRASIAAFVDAWTGPLNILINNAAVMALPTLEVTAEGWEKHFAINHLGHFALAKGLREALAAGSTTEFASRIVSVSSSAHFSSPVIFDDIHFRYRRYEPWLAYAQSKSANVLFAVEATRRWSAEGIFANAHTPGYIRTNLQRHLPPDFPEPRRVKTIEQGAANSALLAVYPLMERLGGEYLADCTPQAASSMRPDDLGGVAPYALDVENARRLWTLSEAMLQA
jgi:NAD(P)-dependent dehydrogenase (short-subunit alcohol dehydrogenase family)